MGFLVNSRSIFLINVARFQNYTQYIISCISNMSVQQIENI